MLSTFNLTPIGWVRKTDADVYIDLDAQFSDALLGLERFSHVMVFYWFHEHDHHSGRHTLQVHPRGNPDNPICGVFATHSPLRPNLIGFTLCRLLKVEENLICIDKIDAINGSPVIDLKCYIPCEPDPKTIRLPDWV